MIEKAKSKILWNCHHSGGVKDVYVVDVRDAEPTDMLRICSDGAHDLNWLSTRLQTPEGVLASMRVEGFLNLWEEMNAYRALANIEGYEFLGLMAEVLELQWEFEGELRSGNDEA